ncbi:MAG: response regulator receiver [Bacteroidaceae bacterium]|nr:response regulator receiver [Bacteroidaceae bacterium]
MQVRTSKPSVFIRSTRLVDDDFEAYYSTDHLPLPGRCLYATRIDNEEWSGWSEKTHYVGSNLWFGDHTFYVRCRDEFGIESETVTLPVHVAWPYYLRWYAWLLYAMTLTILIQLIIRWRTNRMRKENMRLERIVEERTSRLQEAQKKLARQEKVEMMGKLIQGLIDRILNPMNYILNFAKLTRSLRNDMQADVEDEQERITGENFADMQDILDMMNTNLTKIEEHSTNTTRILKAMEELMHDRNEVTGEMSLTDMLAKCEEMTRTYYHDDIERMGVEVRFDISPEHIILYGNADFISKSIMSMIANSFYSMRKKFEQAAYSPALHVSLEKAKNMAVLKIRDNGLGIEDAIKAKIFDPFFTTKPTAEAPGVGLYLTRDIVQTHHGDITCDSVKGEYCEFIIQLRLDKHRPQKEAAGK